MRAWSGWITAAVFAVLLIGAGIWGVRQQMKVRQLRKQLATAQQAVQASKKRADAADNRAKAATSKAKAVLTKVKARMPPPVAAAPVPTDPAASESDRTEQLMQVLRERRLRRRVEAGRLGARKEVRKFAAANDLTPEQTDEVSVIVDDLFLGFVDLRDAVGSGELDDAAARDEMRDLRDQVEDDLSSVIGTENTARLGRRILKQMEF